MGHMVNEKEAKNLFDAEVNSICNVLGLDSAPKYSFRLYDGPSSRVRPRLCRKPIVEIRCEEYDEHPYVLAQEAGHLGFSHFRKTNGLRDKAGYSEVFDYLNQVRRMYENNDIEKAESYRNSFKSIDQFIEAYEQLASQEKSSKKIAELFMRQSKEYGGESTEHIIGIAYIRSAFKSGLQGAEQIAEFLKSLSKRSTDTGVRMLSGDYRGILKEFQFFREETKRIMRE